MYNHVVYRQLNQAKNSLPLSVHSLFLCNIIVHCAYVNCKIYSQVLFWFAVHCVQWETKFYYRKSCSKFYSILCLVSLTNHSIPNESKYKKIVTNAMYLLLTGFVYDASQMLYATQKVVYVIAFLQFFCTSYHHFGHVCSCVT